MCASTPLNEKQQRLVSAAHAALSAYDRSHQEVVRGEVAKSVKPGPAANAFGQQYADRDLLRGAVFTLRKAVRAVDGRIMLGICAPDAPDGVECLKQWVSALELPRGLLHGMDKDGEPLDMTNFGSVYIKYNSKATERDGPGTATLAGYGGDFRGIYLNIDLRDGEFRQYAVLPIDLLSEGALPAALPAAAGDDAAAASTVAAAKPPLSETAVRAALAPLLSALRELDVSTTLERADASTGCVELRYRGPPKPQRSIEYLLRNEFDGVKSVEFLDMPVEGAPPRPAAAAAATATGDTSVRVPERFASAGARFKSRALEASESNAFATLHTQGWVLLREQPRLLGASTLAAVRASKFEPIFNGHAPGEAPLRFMGVDGIWSKQLEDIFTDGLATAGLLACSDGVSVKTVNDCYALRSLPCAEDERKAETLGRQPPHSDCPAPEEGCTPLAELPDADMPLSVLLAIEPGTKLWVFPEGCEAEDAAFVVHLEVGDMMAWRGDLVHAGAGYAHEHVRVHAYVDPPASCYVRPKGKTNLCALRTQ